MKKIAKDTNQFSVLVFLCVSGLWGVQVLNHSSSAKVEQSFRPAQQWSLSMSKTDPTLELAKRETYLNSQTDTSSQEIHHSIREMQRILRCSAGKRCQMEASEAASYQLVQNTR